MGVNQEFQRNDSALRMEVKESFVKLSDDDTLKTSQFYYELLLSHIYICIDIFKQCQI